MKKAVEGLLTLAKFAPNLPKEITDLANNLKLTPSGTVLNGSLLVKGDMLKNLANNPMAMMGGFGGAPTGKQPIRPTNPGGIKPAGPGGLNPPGPGGTRPGGGRPGPGGGKRPGGGGPPG